MTKRSNHIASIKKKKNVPCSVKINEILRYATTWRNLDSTMLQEASHMKNASRSRTPLLRNHHAETNQNGLYRGLRMGKKMGRCAGYSFSVGWRKISRDGPRG